MTDVTEWEAVGTRIDVGGEAVWMCDLAPTGPPVGDPVLVLHGFPSSSFDWRHVVGDWRAAGAASCCSTSSASACRPSPTAGTASGCTGHGDRGRRARRARAGGARDPRHG